MTDRSVPFTLSVKLSFLTRLERVLDLAHAQGMLHGPRGKTNKLAFELLERSVANLESDFLALGLVTPTPSALPTAARVATDPATRAAVRAAHDARTAHMANVAGAAPVVSPLQATLEAGYRAALHAASPFVSELDAPEPGSLPEPPGVDWDQTP